ncbi:MAG: sugar phosphate isomerase/epimerase [Cyclobacteriaceae bacterium]|nr:sugar phosphate isomerase/epimerase [Cyclobacteriaceae bacterium]
MDTNRRKFLKLLAAFPALAAIPPVSSACRAARSKDFGIITITLRQPLQENFKGTIAYLAELGYRKIEFGSFANILPEEDAKKILEDHGLKPVAGGASISNLLNNFQKEAELIHFYNKEFLICYWPWHGSADNKKADDFKKVAEELNIVGENARKEGFKFAFHNHDQEFVRTGPDELGYDILLRETDPDLVHMQLDVYWTYKGDADPVAYMKKHPHRFPLLHMKDMDDTPQRDFAVVGDGIIDFGKVMQQGDAIGVKHYIVEHDRPEDPLYCARRSIEHLKSLS